MDGLDAAKEELRARIRAELRSIPPAERLRRGRAAAAHLATLAPLSEARPLTVLAFLSFGAEIPTGPLLEALARRPQTRVLVPFLAGDVMEATPYREGDALEATDYGPLEPARRDAEDPRRIDVAVVPGLAFDPQGNRVGRGGGFVDAYLPRLRPDARVVGFAYREQLVVEVPSGPLDRPVQAVVTDRGVVECGESLRGAAR